MKYNTQFSKKYSSFFKRLMTGVILAIVPLLYISIIYPTTASAGLFSFLTSAFENQQASAKVSPMVITPTSQTIALLQATVNQDPNPDFSSSSVPVIDGKALVADPATGNSLGVEEPANTEISIYVVRSGDTLSGIAKLFGVSVNTILWANSDQGISRSSPLMTGQTLIILPVSGINYAVKKGDTIKGIVSRYKADLNEVLQYNDLTVASALKVGQTIVIPDAELQTQVVSTHQNKINTNEPLFGADGPNYPGYYIRPIIGGYRSQGLHGYNAVDLAGVPVGTPIRASASGTVIISAYNSGWHGGYGNYIAISHPNGTQTLYAHLSKNLVHVGDYVSQGQEIGLLGSTGNSTGPHVHFEIRGAQNSF